MTGKHLKYILRDSFPVERGARWILFFCKRSATRYSQPGFYWGAPSQTSIGFNWTKPFLEEYECRRFSFFGKREMEAIFNIEDFSYLSASMVNAITMCEVNEITGGSKAHMTFSWRAILPTLVRLLNLSPSGNKANTTRDEATIIPPDVTNEHMSVPCQLVCMAVLSKLAADNVNSFDEVHSQQWDDMAQDAIVAVQAEDWQFEPRWYNPDVVGPNDGFNPIAQIRQKKLIRLILPNTFF